MNTGQFERTVRDSINRLVPTASTVGIALSGGADSVALLTAVRCIGIDAVALHCNFHLRGEDSDGDAAYCRDLCRRLGVPVEVVDFDTRAEQTPGESIEMTCRRLRYKWFEERAQTLGLSAVMTAHHADDDAETVLLNLFRGTGPEGLRGIPRRRGIFIRPLLSLSRRDILDYLSALSIPYRTDATNLQSVYRRNAIRNEVLPTALQFFPDAVKSINATAANVDSTQTLLDELVQKAISPYWDGNSLDVMGVKEDFHNCEQLLFYALRQCYGIGVNIETAGEIRAAAEGSGKRFALLDGRILSLDYGRLSLLPGPIEDVAVTFDIQTPGSYPPQLGISKIEDCSSLPLRCPDDTILLDASVEGKLLELRRTRSNDRMQPFGMRGTKLVSDILADKKLTAAQRRGALVLTADGEIIWVAGVRRSAHYAVTDKSRAVWQIRML